MGLVGCVMGMRTVFSVTVMVISRVCRCYRRRNVSASVIRGTFYTWIKASVFSNVQKAPILLSRASLGPAKHVLHNALNAPPQAFALHALQVSISTRSNACPHVPPLTSKIHCSTSAKNVHPLVMNVSQQNSVFLAKLAFISTQTWRVWLIAQMGFTARWRQWLVKSVKSHATLARASRLV